MFALPSYPVPCCCVIYSDVFLIVAFSAFPSYERGGFDCLSVLLHSSVRAIVYMWEIADRFCLIKPFTPSFDPLNHAGWEKDALAETRTPEITEIPEGNPLYWILFELLTTLPCCDTLFAAFIWTTANHCAGRLPGYLYT